MKLQKKFAIGLMVLIGAIFIAGVTAVAVTNYGTQSNPLATKSYVDNVVGKDILNSLNSSVTAKAKELESKFSSQISSAQTGDITGAPSSFAAVTLNSNQVIRCSLGSEIIVLSGGATCYGNGPDWLLDTTTGTKLTSAGAAMTNNHMYVVSVNRNGLRARANGTTVMVSGTYTIGE